MSSAVPARQRLLHSASRTLQRRHERHSALVQRVNTQRHNCLHTALEILNSEWFRTSDAPANALNCFADGWNASVEVPALTRQGAPIISVWRHLDNLINAALRVVCCKSSWQHRQRQLDNLWGVDHASLASTDYNSKMFFSVVHF